MLPHEDQIPTIQPNLGFQDKQEDIINQLNTLTWRRKKSLNDYRRLNFLLEHEEDNVEYWEGVL